MAATGLDAVPLQIPRFALRVHLETPERRTKELKPSLAASVDHLCFFDSAENIKPFQRSRLGI